MKACPTVKRECAGRPAPGPGACIINTNPHSRPPLRMLELTTLTLTLPAQGPGAGIINVYPHTSGPNSGHYQRLPSHLRAQRRALSTLTLNLREQEAGIINVNPQPQGEGRLFAQRFSLLGRMEASLRRGFSLPGRKEVSLRRVSLYSPKECIPHGAPPVHTRTHSVHTRTREGYLPTNDGREAYTTVGRLEGGIYHCWETRGRHIPLLGGSQGGVYTRLYLPPSLSGWVIPC